MTDLWQEAIASAERALRGDAAARQQASAVSRDLLQGKPAPLHRPNFGRDLAYLTALLDTLGLTEESHALTENVALAIHLLRESKSLPLPSDVSNELAVALADRGHALAADNVLWGSYARDGGDAAKARNLANQAAIALRMGGSPSRAADVARSARSLLPSVPLQEALEIRLLIESVLAEAARRGRFHAQADELVHAIARTGRELVRLLGGDHPTSLSALVALAWAEFGSALAAGDQERSERAVDVLAVAAQKASATLGSRHPLALSALVNLAVAEFDAARAAGDQRRLDAAQAMVIATAQRCERGPEATPRTPQSPSVIEAEAPERSVAGQEQPALKSTRPGSRALSLSRADRNRPAEPAVGPERTDTQHPPTVLLTLQPLMYGDRYSWIIHLVTSSGDRLAMASDERGAPFHMTVAALQEHLTRIVRIADRGNTLATVEIVLPSDRFDDEGYVRAIMRYADNQELGTGVRRPVVVRCWKRERQREWRERWHDLTSRTNLSALHISPFDRSLGYEELRQAPAEMVPVLCGPVGHGAGRRKMEDILDAGHGVAFWCSVPQHPPGSCGPVCDFYRSEVDALLSRVTSAYELPEAVQELRARARDHTQGSTPEREALWHLGLLYDDADSPLPV